MLTLLIESNDFLTPPKGVLELISEAQRMSMEIGISKRAVIDPSSFIGILTITQKFKTRKEAEEWLDQD